MVPSIFLATYWEKKIKKILKSGEFRPLFIKKSFDEVEIGFFKSKLAKYTKKKFDCFFWFLKVVSVKSDLFKH